MSAHARIIIKDHRDRYATAYVHHDGYIDGVGRELIEAFNSEAEATRIVAAGGWSTLGVSKGRGQFGRPYPAEAYDDTNPVVYDTLDEAQCDVEFAYAWINERWNLVTPGGYLAPLAAIVAQIDTQS